MDKIAPGSTDQSILFALDTAGLTIADMKLGYIRWDEGDGTSFSETVSSALTALASITTAHTDNYAIYLDDDATGGNKFVIRVDFPDAAFATGKDRVICSVYDDGNSVIAHRIFDLKPDLSKYVNGFVYVDDAGSSGSTLGTNGTIDNPVDNLADAKTLADQLGKKIALRGTFLGQAIDLSLYEIFGLSDDAKIIGDTTTGLTVAGAHLHNMGVGGDVIGNSTTRFFNCILYDFGQTVANSGFRGIATNCKIDGDIELTGASYATFDKCFSTINTVATSPAVIKFNGTGNANLLVTDFGGKLSIEDMDDSDQEAEIYSNGQTRLDIASSCTAGSIMHLGVKDLNDSSAGTTVTRLDDGTAVQAGCNAALVALNLDHLLAVADSDDVVDNSVIAKMADQSATANWSSFNNQQHSLRAIAGAIPGVIYSWVPVIPESIDLADTTTVRLGIAVSDAIGDLPSTAEITPGTISIDRKAIGGTSWSSVVSDAACSEQAGMIYYDEVFDSGTGYAEGDSIRITFKSQKVVYGEADYEFSDSNGVIFQAYIRSTMRGTDSAALATVCTESRLSELDSANLPTDVDAIKAQTDNRPDGIKKNTALSNFMFFMVDTADHISGKTGLTITATRSIDGAAFSSCVNSASEVGNGFYKIDLDSTDLNGDIISFRFIGSGADDRVITVKTDT